MRAAAAMVRGFGTDCHIQLEDRVASALYQSNGNVLLDKLWGATFHSYPEGEDGASAEGKTPYDIPLGADSAPTGALEYVAAALELVEADLPPFDDIIVSSGSGLTHAGLLAWPKGTGQHDADLWRLYRSKCRRHRSARVAKQAADVATLMGLDVQVPSTVVRLFDGILAPGYGQLNDAVLSVIKQTPQLEGLLLDSVYTGKGMAGALALAKAKYLAERRVLLWHTGGTPALFA